MKRGAGELSAATTTEEVRGVLTGWVAAGLNAKPSGRAHWIGGVPVGEPHARFGQAVNVGSLIKAAWIVGSDVHVAKVIDKDQNVGLALK